MNNEPLVVLQDPNPNSATNAGIPCRLPLSDSTRESGGYPPALAMAQQPWFGGRVLWSKRFDPNQLLMEYNMSYNVENYDPLHAVWADMFNSSFSHMQADVDIILVFFGPEEVKGRVRIDKYNFPRVDDAGNIDTTTDQDRLRATHEFIDLTQTNFYTSRLQTANLYNYKQRYARVEDSQNMVAAAWLPTPVDPAKPNGLQTIEKTFQPATGPLHARSNVDYQPWASFKLFVDMPVVTAPAYPDSVWIMWWLNFTNIKYKHVKGYTESFQNRQLIYGAN